MTGPRIGRRPRTTRAEIARVAMQLFAAQGFDTTTVEEIADAVGIGRRTFFRYFPSKNDIVWGDWARELERLRRLLHEVGDDLPLMPAVREAVLAANDFHADDLPDLRVRVTLMTTVPTLQAHSSLRYGEWRQVIASYAGWRLSVDPADLVPQTLAYATLGVTLAAFLRWVQTGGDLRPLLEEALLLLESGFTPA